jgi:hypothetical protein
MRLCTFGDTTSFCERSLLIAAGESIDLAFDVAWTAKPIPRYPCSFDDCLTVTRGDAEITAGNSEFLEIYMLRGLQLSLRPDGFAGILDPVSVTEDVRSSEACYRVLVLPADTADRRALELADDEEGTVLAKTRSEAVACD